MRRFAPYLGASALVLGLLGYAVVSYRVADGITKLERKPLVPSADTVWTSHEDVSFRATDGLLLKGWWFKGQQAALSGRSSPDFSANKAVVFVHGRGQNRIASSFRPDKIAPLFLARGWDVLLFDLRGHGESEGERYSLGQYEPRDIVAAVEFAAKNAGVPKQRVAVIGESLGGGSAIMTVALDPTIGPVVTDSAYADAYTVVSEVGQNYTGLPSWFTPRIALAGKLFGTDVKAASANPNTELWMIDGCDHVQAFTDHPVEWQQRVLAFFDREIARAPSALSR
ncbi:MAG: alpha/beta fold hydrolase [Chloroflexota bacterium]|nr:alpha/beta fold hydrolase [Chloroflexota bacterium]